MSISRRQAAAALSALPLAAMTGSGTGVASAPARPRRTVHIAGDSTAADKYARAAPEAGWGMALPFLLGKGIAVANHAVNGRSSKSFIDEGRLTALLAVVRPGDLLLVQFGHNDEKADDPARYTEPWSTYQDCLRRYLKGARDAGARPVLLTSVERRRFDAAGGAVPTHGEYPAAVRALAAEERVPLLDSQAQSLALWQRLGPETTKSYFNWLPPGESPNYPSGVSDNTHFRPTGAVAVARLVARALRDERVLAPGELRRLDEEIPESWLSWLDNPVA
ncbi:rhamnogalacturonan acetylesterase [Streptomyces paludis]|uniref:Rhamnogalacturonan acetylesterase n=1 Tax=Streptomyces paludis TaxID=2282738 RepID=A0A345HI56_9ACTN|nr:rhamnogalacturonan acetylesterase [Streptomyces paludis]AXG76380.1 rhamnogalacturonan acetylesterase [Streptomyces paludis]